MLAARKLRLQKVINIEITRIKNDILVSCNRNIPIKPLINTNKNGNISTETYDFASANNVISNAIDENLDYVYCGNTLVDLRMHQPL